MVKAENALEPYVEARIWDTSNAQSAYKVNLH